MRVLKGSIDHILSYCAHRHFHSARALWIAKPSDPPFGWTAIRDLLGQIAARAGEAGVAAVLARHRAAASLVIPAFQAGLDAEQVQVRETLAACLESHLSHNWLLQRGLQEAWAAILSELLGEGEVEILITLPSLLDDMSFDTFRTLLRLSPGALADASVGHDSEVSEPEVDANGIAWRASPGDNRIFLFGLRSSGGVEVLSLSGGDARSGAPLPSADGPLFGGDYEAAALAALQEGAGPSGCIARTIRFCFEGFNFAGALRLGVAFLAARPEPEPSLAADLHAMVSLAAHNMMFYSRDPRLIAFLEHHLAAALAVETRPVRRCALLYRMAVTLGRRKKDFPAALQWADRAILEARSPGLPALQSRYQEAWVRNIRAYLSMSLGRRKEAMADAEAGFDLLADVDTQGEPVAGGERRWLLDARMTRAILSSNLCALARQAGDLPAIGRWSRREAQVAAGLPGMARFTAVNWIDYHRRTMRLDLALADAVAGIAGAIAERDAYREYVLNVEAGDLSYRLGKAEDGWAFLKRAAALREVSDAQDVFAPLDVQLATAAMRAGRLAEAESILQPLLRQGGFDADARAEMWIVLATAAALAGERPEALERMDRAIDLAVETGERNSLHRAANAAGDLYRHFGEREQARSAYERAFEIAGAEIEGAPPPAADLLRTLLGLRETSGPEAAVAVLDLRLLPEALQEWDVWWDLGRILAQVSAVLGRRSMLDLPRQDLESMQLLVTAARQRPDCAAALGPFVASLPEDARQALRASEVLV